MTAHIRIGDTTPRVQYQADGNQTAFPFAFPVFAADDVHVYLNDTLVSTGFTVTGAGTDDGGTVTFATAPAGGTRVTLLRRMDIERVSDFQAGGPLRAAALNDELDALTAIDQQLNEALTRCVRVGPGSPMTISLDLPGPSAGAVLGWNDSGDALVNDPLDYVGLAADIARLRDGIPEAAASVSAAAAWAEDAALSAWRASLAADSDGPGPADDLTVTSLTTLGNVAVGGALTVAGSGTDQAVATRQDSPTADALPFWNDAANRLDSSGLAWTGGLLTYPLAAFKVSSAITGATATVALTDGEFQVFTVGADTVFTLPDPPVGHGYSVTLKLVQDTTGGRTPTFQQADSTAAVWLGGSAPTWQTTSGDFDLVVLTHDGTDLVASHIGGVD